MQTSILLFCVKFPNILLGMTLPLYIFLLISDFICAFLFNLILNSILSLILRLCIWNIYLDLNLCKTMINVYFRHLIVLRIQCGMQCLLNHCYFSLYFSYSSIVCCFPIVQRLIKSTLFSAEVSMVSIALYLFTDVLSKIRSVYVFINAIIYITFEEIDIVLVV